MNGKTLYRFIHLLNWLPDDVLEDIEITVATTLWNKMRVTWSSFFGSAAVESIGLAGPVVLT